MKYFSKTNQTKPTVFHSATQTGRFGGGVAGALHRRYGSFKTGKADEVMGFGDDEPADLPKENALRNAKYTEKRKIWV
ncbi:hypothetical protein EVAR_712_1 [Eumeta japonica]|uniref:Uncharacterized protein n=1 Tax=Eumeta variegata TaxID=151549 RepID=A0A4C1SBL6_EUMVA|nr:hypothetical protein EVAR_712_1 [Eumeta japonica]